MLLPLLTFVRSIYTRRNFFYFYFLLRRCHLTFFSHLHAVMASETSNSTSPTPPSSPVSESVSIGLLHEYYYLFFNSIDLLLCFKCVFPIYEYLSIKTLTMSSYFLLEHGTLRCIKRDLFSSCYAHLSDYFLLLLLLLN